MIVFGILFFNSYAQNIEMEFPHFAGKAYDFIIFQGSSSKTLIQDTIPKDGKFTLRIPKQYAPYRGMSRWLITGTKEGGGLDMLIPGHDFSVSCKEATPNDHNIIYTENKEIPELNTLYKRQQEIFAKHDAMLQAIKSFPKKDKNYSVFEKEYQNQLKAYEYFQKELNQKADYTANFLRIVNITQGIGTDILDSEEKRAKNIAHYIAEDLSWEDLYTSGHWAGVISSWVDIYSIVFDNSEEFSSDFEKISKKITDTDQYTDFAGRVASSLNRNGKDNFIKTIAPVVRASGKVRSYEGSLSVFISGIEGSQAADLEITTRAKEDKEESLALKISDLPGKGYHKTLLVFYQSGCGGCELLLKELPEKYESLKSKGVRVIFLSSDKDETVFRNKVKDLPWKDVYCDYKGMDGINFKNYGVTGTPTMFLIESSGKIILRSALLEEIMKKL